MNKKKTNFLKPENERMKEFFINKELFMKSERNILNVL